MMNEQEMFNKAYTGVIAQGGVAQFSNGKCCYRLIKEDGTVLACGVGQLIDDKTAAMFDGAKDSGIKQIILAGKVPEKYAYFEDHAYFLHELQRVHDMAYDLAGFKNRMAKLAEKRNLTVSE